MASIIKHPNGWRAFVARQGVRRSKLFATKREAQDWAARAEYEIIHADKVADATPLGDVLDRYAREVSVKRRGHRWEVVRLEKMRRDPIARVRMGELAPKHLAEWRDRRLRDVAGASVKREMELLSAVLTIARREWCLIQRNPLSDVARPPASPPRTRLPTAAEFERLAHAAGPDLSSAIARTHHAFLFACETAMRAGEIVGLTWADVDLDRRVAHLTRTKNGHPRDVPLTTKAVVLLQALPQMQPIFGLTSQQRDALWRKLTARAGVQGLHFHDSRAWATTQLARKVDVLTLAKITGHRDVRMLSNVYYRERAEDIAKRLD